MPQQNPLRLKSINHVEFFVGNAKQAAFFYRNAFGFSQVAYAGLETGRRNAASYALQQGKVRLVLTTAFAPGDPVAAHVARHGDGVKDIAFHVDDADLAFAEAVARGATPVVEPRDLADEHGAIRHAAIATYGDTIHSLISYRDYAGPFLPGFTERHVPAPRDAGLLRIDHMVGNVELGRMNEWADWYSRVLGFDRYISFDDKDISTEYSALMSMVMSDGTRTRSSSRSTSRRRGSGSRRSTSTSTTTAGPACSTSRCSPTTSSHTVTVLRENGVEFLNVPDSYYDMLSSRVGEIDEALDTLKRLRHPGRPRRGRLPAADLHEAGRSTAPRCSSRSSSARAAAGSARGTSAPCSRPSSVSRPCAAISDPWKGATTVCPSIARLDPFPASATWSSANPAVRCTPRNWSATRGSLVPRRCSTTCSSRPRSWPAACWRRSTGAPKPTGAFGHRHFRTAQLRASQSLTLDRVPLLVNADVAMSMALPTADDNFYFRNAQGDEVIYVSDGAGVLETQLGEIDFRRGDYLVIPRGILYRAHFTEPANAVPRDREPRVRARRRVATATTMGSCSRTRRTGARHPSARHACRSHDDKGRVPDPRQESTTASPSSCSTTIRSTWSGGTATTTRGRSTSTTSSRASAGSTCRRRCTRRSRATGS